MVHMQAAGTVQHWPRPSPTPSETLPTLRESQNPKPQTLNPKPRAQWEQGAPGGGAAGAPLQLPFHSDPGQVLIRICMA